MSTLLFDGALHQLTLFDSSGKAVGRWDANNIVDHRATLRFVPNGTHRLVDTHRPHKHAASEDSIDGAYGRFGIIRLQDFSVAGIVHSGVGIHAGRANREGPNHATMGCIRTTDAAMEFITGFIANDPVTRIDIQSNRVQHNPTPHYRGDHHHPHRQFHPGPPIRLPAMGPSGVRFERTL